MAFSAWGFTKGIGSAIASPFKWGFDAIKATNKRQAPNSVNRSGDADLNQFERARLLSTGRDLRNNFELLGWAVRKHLDYVSTFTFQGKCPDEVKNKKIEAFVLKWSHKDRFDVAARHNLQRFIRLAEERRMIDGDIFIYKLADGTVQAIEGDRIRNHSGSLIGLSEDFQMIQGVIVNGSGKALKYALHKRTRSVSDFSQAGGFVFEDMLPHEYVFHHAYWLRFDQTRGISPLAGVYNALRDLYESFDYALAKMKISQLLGLVVFRDSKDSLGDEQDNTAEVDEDGNPKPRCTVDIGKSPFKLELEGPDRAEFIESKNPSAEFQAFAQLMISLVLKALDIPYSFYAENFSTYSGSRQALLQYEQSAEHRRNDNRDLLNDLTAWRLKMAIDAEDPDLAGVTVEDLQWEWVSASLPWIDPIKEVAANTAAVQQGFTSTVAVCKEQGTDAFAIAEEQANYELRVMKMRLEKGLPAFPTSAPVTYTEVVDSKDQPNAQAA